MSNYFSPEVLNLICWALIVGEFLHDDFFFPHGNLVIYLRNFTNKHVMTNVISIIFKRIRMFLLFFCSFWEFLLIFCFKSNYITLCFVVLCTYSVEVKSVLKVTVWYLPCLWELLVKLLKNMCWFVVQGISSISFDKNMKYFWMVLVHDSAIFNLLFCHHLFVFTPGNVLETQGLIVQKNNLIST